MNAIPISAHAATATQRNAVDWVDLLLADAPIDRVVSAFREMHEAARVEEMYRRQAEMRRVYAPRRHAFQAAVLQSALRAKNRNAVLIRGLRRALRRDGEKSANGGYEIASADSQRLNREAISAMQMLAGARGLYLIVGQHQTRLRNMDTPLSREARLAITADFHRLSKLEGQ
jgi:hypothetical protein